MISESLIDSLCGTTSVLLFFGYHVYYYTLIKRFPFETSFGQNHSIRRCWVLFSMNKPAELRNDMTSVQAIRNGLMASSLLASTSITLGSAVAALILNQERSNNFITLFGINGIGVHPLYKMFMLLFFFLAAFFSLMQSIRASTHASFAICMPLRYEGSIVDCEYVISMLQRAATFYTAGTRSFYAAFIMLLWLFGPIPPVLGSIFIIYVCWLLDVLPRRERRNSNFPV
jgi:uncharacterized membrane protein